MLGLTWSRTGTDDAGGHGEGTRRPDLLFLHGWGLAPGAYRQPLQRLRQLGCTIAAPSLPGFGGCPPLSRSDCSFAGYARWAAGYVETWARAGPVTVVGHSFGGGIAVQLAYDRPDLVRSLVLCNAVGGPAVIGPSGPRPMAERPLWEWGRHFGVDLLAPGSAVRVLPPVLEAAVGNLVQHPLSVWRVGDFVRRADLVAQLGEVARRGTPVTVVWSDRDRIAPRAGFAALADAAGADAAGADGETVPGPHNWLLADAERFADVVWRALAAAGVLDEAIGLPHPGRDI